MRQYACLTSSGASKRCHKPAPQRRKLQARSTNSLSTRWAINCPSSSRPLVLGRNVTPDLPVRLSPQLHTRVATCAWLSRSFMRHLRKRLARSLLSRRRPPAHRTRSASSERSRPASVNRGAEAAFVTVRFVVARKLRSATERGNAIMLRTLKCPVIALEEHYWDKELAALFVGAEGVRDP